MDIFGRHVERRGALWILLHILIIIDIILISVGLIFNLPENFATFIQVFDLCICIILLLEWSFSFYTSESKKDFLNKRSNWIDLIASIPFDVILPIMIPQAGLLRYFRLLKLLRVIVLFNRFVHGVDRFIQKTNLDKILGGVFFIILFFTLLLYFYGPTYDLFDDFYFVIVTLTTVGYGDVTPKTFNEKLIAMILIFFGIFVFSTITAALSSFLTERLMNEDEDDIFQIVDSKIDPINEELSGIRRELEISNRKNQEMKDEIRELKELIKRND